MLLALWGCSSPAVVPPVDLDSTAVRARGAELFQSKCALCHGVRADGNGVRKTGLSHRPPNFRSSQWRAETNAQRIYTFVREGKEGTSMPAWPALSDEEAWSVVAYVLSVSENGE